MLPRNNDLPKYGATDGSDLVTPEEEDAIRSQLARVEEEKQAALAHPGPSWHEWFYYRATKWYIGLGLLILDSWVIAYWVGEATGGLAERGAGLAATLGLAVYAEFLLAQYLWHRPSSRSTRAPGPFQSRWFRPVAVGRWTPEAADLAAGEPLPPVDAGPDPKEFL